MSPLTINTQPWSRTGVVYGRPSNWNHRRLLYGQTHGSRWSGIGLVGVWGGVMKGDGSGRCGGRGKGRGVVYGRLSNIWSDT